VIGSPPAAAVFWDNPVFTVGGGKRSNIHLAASEGDIERDLRVELYGEALLEEADNGWRLKSVKVDKSISGDEWMELTKSSRS
jgi:hypothetical protein